MKAGEEWKPVFQTRYRHFEYMIMLFELINAPVICQALVNNIIRTYLDQIAIVYLDDILIYSNMLSM